MPWTRWRENDPPETGTSCELIAVNGTQSHAWVLASQDHSVRVKRHTFILQSSPVPYGACGRLRSTGPLEAAPVQVARRDIVLRSDLTGTGHPSDRQNTRLKCSHYIAHSM